MSLMNKYKVCLLLSYISIASVSAAIITPSLPQIEQAYALSHGSIEWVISIFLMGYVIGQLIYGPVANRYGRLRALRSGLALNIAGILICMLSIWFLNFSMLLLGRLVTALGSASGLACTFMLINELCAEEQAKRAMSYAVVSFTVGIGLAVSLGGLITQYLSWEYSFILLLIHGITMLLLTLMFKDTKQKQVAIIPRTILLGFKNAVQNKQLVVFSLTVGLCSAVSYCYSAASPIYAQQQLHLSPGAYGTWNFLNMAGMMGSGILGAFLIKKFGTKFLLVFALIGMIPAVFSLGHMAITNQSDIWLFFMTTMFLYFYSGLLFPAASYYASNAIDDKASASSMMSFINMGSAMFAVVIMGYLPFSSIVSLSLVVGCFWGLIFILVMGYFIFEDKNSLALQVQ